MLILLNYVTNLCTPYFLTFLNDIYILCRYQKGISLKCNCYEKKLVVVISFSVFLSSFFSAFIVFV